MKIKYLTQTLISINITPIYMYIIFLFSDICQIKMLIYRHKQNQ